MTAPPAASPCCAPPPAARGEPGNATAHRQVSDARGAPHTSAHPQAVRRALRESAVRVPGGTALVGTDRPVFRVDGEGPLRRVRLRPFRISPTTVTNAQFAAFVAATGYVTEAERFGWSFVFFSQVHPAIAASQAVAGLEWWRRIDGACWSAVEGPMAAPPPPDHPAVHVSWNDAVAFARWAGGRLPTEAEWEHAARGGLDDVPFPWGTEEPGDDGPFPCNIWQGSFPARNTAADGYLWTAPAQSFAPNGLGLYNMVGNVWEWCADPYRLRSLRRAARARMATQAGWRLAKGGSFLCHKSYCFRYRIAARIGNSPDSTTTHTGFRVVFDD